MGQRSFQEIVELELAYEHTNFVKSSAEAAFVQLVSVSETIKIRDGRGQRCRWQTWRTFRPPLAHHVLALKEEHLALEAVPLVEELLTDLLQVVHGGGVEVGHGGRLLLCSSSTPPPSQAVNNFNILASCQVEIFFHIVRQLV